MVSRRNSPFQEAHCGFISQIRASQVEQRKNPTHDGWVIYSTANSSRIPFLRFAHTTSFLELGAFVTQQKNSSDGTRNSQSLSFQSFSDSNNSLRCLMLSSVRCVTRNDLNGLKPSRCNSRITVWCETLLPSMLETIFATERIDACRLCVSVAPTPSSAIVIFLLAPQPDLFLKGTLRSKGLTSAHLKSKSAKITNKITTSSLSVSVCLSTQRFARLLIGFWAE